MNDDYKTAQIAPGGRGAHTDAEPLILVATSGTGGDILPFITLSQGLLQRGRRVRMLVPRFHEPLVTAAGIPCLTFADDEAWRVLLSNPDLWDERKGWGVIWRGLVPHLGALRECIAQLPAHESCVVLAHPILVPMAALARSLRPDLRIVAAHLAPANLCSSHDMLTAGSLRIPAWVPIPWRQALWRLIHRGWIDPVTLPHLNAARGRAGLPAVAHFFDHLLAAPSVSMGLFPSWYAPTAPDWPSSFSDGDFVAPGAQSAAALSSELQQFLSSGDAPIVFTPGTGHQHAAQYFAVALKALQGLGRRGIFVTPHAAQLPAALPGSVLWQAHTPFCALLPRAAALVHHGGIGTTADAFRSGTPQLIVPFAYDQFDNGLRARQLGVADVLLAKRLSASRMRTQLARLLSSSDVAQACSALARKMEQGPDLPWLLDRVEAALFPPPATPSNPLRDCTPMRLRPRVH